MLFGSVTLERPVMDTLVGLLGRQLQPRAQENVGWRDGLGMISVDVMLKASCCFKLDG